MRALVVALILAACAARAPRPSAPTQLRDRFLERARSAGVALSFTPELREWTRPSMISWRQAQRAVALPRWEELSPPQRALVVRMAGSEADAPHLFAQLFRWFLVAHELTHALQDNAGAAQLDHATSERRANDVAVAFFATENRQQLLALGTLLAAARDRLPPLTEFRDEAELDAYFNAHYDELGRDLPRYGAFQVRFILDSLARIDALTFDEAVRRATGA